MMNRADAAAILQIPPTASPEEARRAYQELFTEHQVRLTNAPTPALRNLYQARLRELDEARDAMSAETSADDADLPLAEPKIPGGSSPGWRSGDSGPTPPPPPPQARAESAPPAASKTAPAADGPKPPAPPVKQSLEQSPSTARVTPPPRSERESGLISDPPRRSKRGIIITVALIGVALAGFFAWRGRTTNGATAILSPADTAAARSRARWLWVRINSGENFEDVAKKESDDSATAANGGDLGAGAETRFGPEFEKVARAIAVPGSTAQPVLDSAGYDLIRLDRRIGNTLSLHRILVRIKHLSDSDLVFVRRQLKENLAIAKTEFERGAYDNADHALSLGEAFTYQMAQPVAEDSIVAPIKTQMEALRTKVDRACYTEDQIAKQRGESPPCKYVNGFQRGWIR